MIARVPALVVLFALGPHRQASAWLDRGFVVDDAAGFAARVSVADEIMVVTALASASTRGFVHVYRRDGDHWEEEQVLTALEPKEGDHFGYSVATDGTTILVGAPGLATAYFFTRHQVSGEWVVTHQRDHPSSAAYGTGVAVQGDVAAVGAFQAGFVEVLRRDGDGWQMQALLDDRDFEDCDNGIDDDGDGSIDSDDPDCAAGAFLTFGATVAIDGDRLVVGAYGAYSGGVSAGRAFLFRYASGAWKAEASLQLDDPPPGDRFGNQCAIDGERVLIAAPAGPEPGAVHVYRRQGQLWKRAQVLVADTPTSGALFGHAISLVGDMAFVGEPGRNANEGAVHAFSEREGGFTRHSLLGNPDAGGAQLFGTRIGFDGEVLAVAAPIDPVGGAVFTYGYAGGSPGDGDAPAEDRPDDPGELDKAGEGEQSDTSGFYGCRAGGDDSGFLIILAALALLCWRR